MYRGPAASAVEIVDGPAHVGAATFEALLSLVGYNKRVLALGTVPKRFADALTDRGCGVTSLPAPPEHDPKATAADHDGRAGFDVVLVLGLGDAVDPLTGLRTAVRHLDPSGYVVTAALNLAHGDFDLALGSGAPAAREDLAASMGLGAVATCEDLGALQLLLVEGGLIPVEIERVIVPLFQSSPLLRRERVSADTVDQLLSEPEAETFVFVLKAVLDNGSQAVTEMAQRLLVLSEAVRGASVQAALLRVERRERSLADDRVHAAQRELAEVGAQLSAHREHVVALEGHAAGLQAQVAVLVDELAKTATALAEVEAQYQALLRSRSVRAARALRRSWARLTRRARP